MFALGFDVVTSDSCNNIASIEPSMSEQKTAVELRDETPTVVVSNEELDDGIVPDNDDVCFSIFLLQKCPLLAFLVGDYSELLR